MTLDLKKILENNVPLTFLVGAGISMEPPTSLVSAWKIIEDVVRFCTPEEASNDISHGEIASLLRYEYLLQIFRDYFDPNLKFIEYFEQAQNPNMIHRFLADMNYKKHHVMTTNFDYLIEHSLMKHPTVDNKSIKLVITKEDFERYSDPEQNLENGYHILYKIHGSLRNLVTNENTKNSIVSTLDAIGKDKEDQEDILAVPLYKRKLFDKIGKDRTLIVMGYSGGDNLDIMPEINRMDNLKEIIWIDHAQQIQEVEKMEIKEFHAINGKELESETKESQIDEFLRNFAVKNDIKVYKIKGNTRSLVESIYSEVPFNLMDEPSKQMIKPYEWLKKVFEEPSDRMKEFCAAVIYFNYNCYEKAIKHYQSTLNFDKQTNNLHDIANSLNRIGISYMFLEKHDKALENYKNAYNIDKQLNNIQGMADDLGNIGLIYMYKGNYEESLENYEQAYKYNEQLGNQRNMANQLGNMAALFMNNGESQKAYENYVKAYEMHEILGNLQEMATILSNVGGLYRQSGDLEVALDYLQKGYEIYEKLNDHYAMASQLSNMALVSKEMEKYSEAISMYKKAYQIFEKIKHPYASIIQESIIEIENMVKKNGNN